MLLFTMYVNDEYSAKQLGIATKKLGKKLKTDIEMVWQWVKKGKKSVIACDFHKLVFKMSFCNNILKKTNIKLKS